jgi:hypothetical protein
MPRKREDSKLRRVRVFKSDNGKKIPDGEGVFHRWGDEFVEYESGPANFTIAVIERDNGMVETPQASLIQFMDKIR